jgi:hypothetical protein
LPDASLGDVDFPNWIDVAIEITHNLWEGARQMDKDYDLLYL